MNIDWSAYQQAFEQFLVSAEELYNGLKNAYSEALVEHAKELTVIQNTSPKSGNGGTTTAAIANQAALDQLPDVLSIITDARKASLTGPIDPHFTDVDISTINAGKINANNKHYQLEVRKNLANLFSFGATGASLERGFNLGCS